MPYYTLVITAGISLFSSHNTFGRLTREWNGFAFERTNPVLKSDKQSKDAAIQQWLAELKPTLTQSKANPEFVSAEYSLLHALQSQNQLFSRPKIILFHTDTLGGEAAARLLAQLLVNDFNAETELKPLRELDVSNHIKLKQAMADFMHQLAQSLQQGEPTTTCFAPIGGYKVMTSYGYMAASIHGYPSAYLHEDSQILHQIPPMPFAFPQPPSELLPLFRKLLRQGNQGIKASELSHFEKNYLQANSAFFEHISEDNDEMWDLNALGKHVFALPETGILRPDLTAKAQSLLKKHLSAVDFINGQLDNLYKKYQVFMADKNSFKGELFHENDFEALKGKPLKKHLYKGASNGELVFRASWYVDERNGEEQLWVDLIWLNHDAYMREAEQYLT